MAISYEQHKGGSPLQAAKRLGAAGSRIPKLRLDMLKLSGRKIKAKEIIFFTSQLSLMLEVGTPLTSSLTAIENQTKNPAFKEVIHAMGKDIEEGLQLSDAMRRHPQVFNHVFISMIKAGETGGFLQGILDRLAEMQEKRQALIAQLRSTLTYPAILCLVGLLVVIFVLVGVLPKFTTFFAGKESILPITTRFLMAMSKSLRGYWWLYLISFVGLIVALKLWKESEPGQALIDRFCVSAPMVARLYNKIYTCQLLRTLGHLMSSQVPLLEALEVTQATIRNRYFSRFITQIINHVEKGGRFAQPFTTYPYILDSVKQMVATGEEVGNLPTVMLRLAGFYDTEVDRELKNIASLIEPIALMLLGGVVGVIVASVILPLFKLAHAVH
ncbi:MAG: type II secretion system F family protein [Deltaproteobacteria bacterium]|nr:type II secretion system F family protein [Deltaproteobacteria bacterium]